MIIYEWHWMGDEHDVQGDLIRNFWPQSTLRMGIRLVKAIEKGYFEDAEEYLSAPPLGNLAPLARLPALAALLCRSGNADRARCVMLEFLNSSVRHGQTPLDYLLAINSPWGPPWNVGDIPPPILQSSTDPEIHFDMALDNLAQDRFLEAGWHFLAYSLPAWPEIALFLENQKKGVVALHRDDPQEAYEHFLKARETEPNLAHSHYWLGLTCNILGYDAEAVAHFRRALELSSDNPELYVELGVALTNNLDWLRAAECFGHAVRLDKNYPRAKKLLERATRLGKIRSTGFKS